MPPGRKLHGFGAKCAKAAHAAVAAPKGVRSIPAGAAPPL